MGLDINVERLVRPSLSRGVESWGVYKNDSPDESYIIDGQDVKTMKRLDIDDYVCIKRVEYYDFEALFGKEHVNEYRLEMESTDHLRFIWEKHPLYPLYEKLMENEPANPFNWYKVTDDDHKLLEAEGIYGDYRERNSYNYQYLTDHIYIQMMRSYHVKDIPIKSVDEFVIYTDNANAWQRDGMNVQFYDFMKIGKLSNFVFEKSVLEYIRDKCAENPDEFQKNIINHFKEGENVVIFDW